VHRLALPQVTVCAVTSVNVHATVKALQHCLDRVIFAECLLFTDSASHESDERIRTIPIARISSSHAYSDFILTRLADFVASSHILIVQWDGFVLDPTQWDEVFLGFDYVGAPWPQFHDGHDVGNGGFSLRTRRLMDACRDPNFRSGHPEDLAICRVNRRMLEKDHGIRFADRATAERFSFEREAPAAPTFGFHGIFNLIPVLGVEAFWGLYQSLDDRSTARVDYPTLMRQLGDGRCPARRRCELTKDWVSGLFAR